MDGRAVEERLSTTGRAVHELVRNDHRARCKLSAQPTDRARGKHLPHPHRPQSPRIRAVRNGVGCELMCHSVPGQERHRHSTDVSDSDRGARLAIRGLYFDLLGSGTEKRIEAGPADHTDAGTRVRAHGTSLHHYMRSGTPQSADVTNSSSRMMPMIYQGHWCSCTRRPKRWVQVSMRCGRVRHCGS